MKNHTFLIIFILVVFSSCTIEDEFTELTSYDDILVETRVYFNDTIVDYNIRFEYYKTDGYNNLIKRNISFGGSTITGRETFSQVFKKYKKSGIKITPEENVDYIMVTFYEVNWGWYSSPFFQYQHDTQEEFTLMYDFESDTHEIIAD